MFDKFCCNINLEEISFHCDFERCVNLFCHPGVGFYRTRFSPARSFGGRISMANHRIQVWKCSEITFLFFWTQPQSLQLSILFRKFPSIIGITVTSSHYCCLCSSPCLSLLVIIQRFVCNRMLRRHLTRVERGDRYVDPVAATGFHFCNQSSVKLILLWLTHFLFLWGRYPSKSFLFSGFWVCSKHSVA